MAKNRNKNRGRGKQQRDTTKIANNRIVNGLELEQEDLEKPLLAQKPPPSSFAENGCCDDGGDDDNDDRERSDVSRGIGDEEEGGKQTQTGLTATNNDNDNDNDNGVNGNQNRSEPGSQSEGREVSLLGKSHCRKTTIVVAVVDLVATMALAYFRSRSTANAPNTHYSFQHSVVDILVLTLLRTVFLVVQAAYFHTATMAKLAGYAALLSFLLMTAKASVAIDWYNDRDEPHNAHDTHDTSLTSSFAIIVIIAVAFSLLEAFCELLVSAFSCTAKDAEEGSAGTTASVAPAAEGISVGETKSIGLLELAMVLKPYFWPDGLFNRVCVFFTWVFLFISKLSNILAPLFIAKATDDLSLNKGAFTATLHIVLYTLLLFANKAFKEAQALSYIRVKLIAGVQLQTNVFSHLLTLSMDWHQRKSTGAVITAMQRGILASNAVVQYLFLYLFPTFVEAIVVCIVFVVHFHAPVLGACAVIGVVLYIAVTVELTIWRMQFRKIMNKADNEAQHRATDSLLNFETVKYFTAEHHEVERYKESVDLSQSQAYKIQGSLSILNTLQQLVLNATLVATLLVAANEYRAGDFSLGQFVAVNVYVIQLFSPLNYLGSIYGFAVGAYVDLQNLCNLLAEKPDVQDRDGARILCPSTPPTPPIVETADNNANAIVHANNNNNNNNAAAKRPLKLQFKNVSFSYPSRKDVLILNNVSFVVPAGSTTAIVGETGSGKSTITRLLFRFYEAEQGKVLVGNQDVLDLTQTSLREHLGTVPQDHALFNDTLEYNLRYGSTHLRKLSCRAAGDKNDNNVLNNDTGTDGKEAVQNAIQAAQLTDFVSSLPDGLQTKVGERGQQVSGGQKQRIAIARVLLKDAPVVILDEATSSLDSNTEEQIQVALFGNKILGEEGKMRLKSNLRGQKTILVIAHRLSTIQDADQIIVMSKGEILERGTHDELIDKGLWHGMCYAALWDKQKKTE